MDEFRSYGRGRSTQYQSHFSKDGRNEEICQRSCFSSQTHQRFITLLSFPSIVLYYRSWNNLTAFGLEFHVFALKIFYDSVSCFLTSFYDRSGAYTTGSVCEVVNGCTWARGKRSTKWHYTRLICKNFKNIAAFDIFIFNASNHAVDNLTQR
jgi:hypothetical protein